MNSISFCLFVIFSLNYALAYPTAETAIPSASLRSNSESGSNSIADVHLSNAHQSEPIRFNKTLEDEKESNENSLLSRFRRCADWFRRIRNRYSRPGMNLFGSNGLFDSFNDGYRYSNRYNDVNTYHHNRLNHEDNYETSNYQPANDDNYESNRINNSPSSTYHVPSSSPPPKFVEANDFVTPPNREEAPASSSSAPVEHTNEDWTSAPDS